MDSFNEIDVQQAEELIKQGNVTIVDIRDQNSFEQDHIESALSVRDSNIEEFVNNADKNKPVLCYCYSGFSSQGAAQYIKDQGFETVYSLIGGFSGWQNAHSGD